MNTCITMLAAKIRHTMKLAALASSAAWCAEFHVSPHGSNERPYTTWETAAHSVYDAVRAARGGGTVIVDSGVYSIACGIRLSSVLSHKY